MKKKLLYTALGLIGLMGTLSIGVCGAQSLLVYSGGTYTIYTGDFSYGITIQSENLGEGYYGYYYQWGNNNGNPGNSATTTQLLDWNDNYENHGYDGPITGFITLIWNSTLKAYNNKWRDIWNETSQGDLQSAYSNWTGNNLRGGGNDNDDSNVNIIKGYHKVDHVVTNPSARQGPCPLGYHVPSIGEWHELMMLRCNSRQDICDASAIKKGGNEFARAYYLSKSGIGSQFANAFNLRSAGNRKPDGLMNNGDGFYWSSSPYDYRAWAMNFYNVNVQPYLSERSQGFSIRCFKDYYIKAPKKTLNLYFMANAGDIEEIGSGAVTENMTGSVFSGSTEKIAELSNTSKTGYVLEYRYLSGTDTAFDFDTTPISGAWADVNNNVYFIAQWTGIKYSVEFTGTEVSGTMANQEFTYGVTGALTANGFTKTGYTFSGWTNGTSYYTDGQEVSNLTTTSGDVVSFTAEWNPNTYTVKFNAGGGNGTMDDQEFTYDVAQDLTGNTFTRDGYTFSGWTDGITVYTDKQNVKNLTGTSGAVVNLTAQWKQNTPSGSSSSGGGSSGGGGGGGSSKNDTKTTTTTGDVKATTGDNTKTPENSNSVDSTQQNSQNDSKANQNNTTQGKTYSEEFQKAYTFAHENKITTMNTIEKADIDKPLTRIAMAKMLSYYAINLLNKEPDTNRKIKFKDVSEKLDAQYAHGVTLAYQLGIMGINMKNNRFRPNDLVTRAEFGTALSRMLFGIADGKDKYYSTHLAKLVEEKIITNDDPNLQELRGYVMIMLMRSAEGK